MRLSIKNAFFAGIIGFVAIFSTICGIVSAEEERNYTIATGSDPLQALDHADYGLPILQPSTPAIQQHGNINIGGAGLFGDGVGIGTENPAGILHVVGTTTIFSGSVGVGTETPVTELHVIGTVTATAFEGDGSLLTGITAGGSGEDTTNDSWTGTGSVYTASGNVGIGTTTTPQADLHIKTESQTEIKIQTTQANGDAHIQYTNDSLRDWRAGMRGITASADYFYIRDETAAADRIVVDTSGYVGIGTAAPDEKFEVEFGSTSKDIELGVGTTDPDVTFVTLRSPNGTKYYITVNDSGTFTSSTSKP